MEAAEKKDIKAIVKNTNLKHIAIIMDGNRRWAKEKHLPSAMGHQKGVDSLRSTMRLFDRFGIKYLTVYAFSTENWNRKKEEVEFLMGLLAKTLLNELDDMHKENVRIRFLGDLTKLSKNLVDIVKNAENKTKDNTGVNLNIAFNYGSRDEITNALKAIIQEGLKSEDITEDTISNHLYTKDIPDPDLLIRTGGEKRISNYLLWQLAYSEIYVTDAYWPEFDENELSKAIVEFEHRNRRFGK
ncbi:TPA: isoprenyl transferase [Candidatus Gastranaerophilales bacterium HUM_21]|nr:MAG TPA: isoprenyl transferase [Candidatus Gastranaerophilales bacterium HUM_21]